MKIKKALSYFILISIVSFLVYVGYHIYGFMTYMDDMGECGLANGPCYGINIKLNLNKEKVDKYIKCPNGKIGFIHTRDDSFPIIFKLDKRSKIKWAYRLETDSCSGIPMKRIRSIKLEGTSIGFFNESYSEPGEIVLTKDYDFDYVCLSPM